MALDSFVKSHLEGQIQLIDGTPTTTTLAFEMGDLSFGPLTAVLNEEVPYERRGKHTSLGLGKRIYPKGTFSAFVHQFTDATADVLSDLILQNNKHSGAVPTIGASARVLTYDIKFNIEGSSYGGVDSTVTFEDCRLIIDELSEGEPTKFAISWTCYGAVTGGLAAAQVT